MRLSLWFGVVVMFNLLNVMLLFQGYRYQWRAVLYIAPTVFAGAAALLCSQVMRKAGLRDRAWPVVLAGAMAGLVGSRLSGLPALSPPRLGTILIGGAVGALVHYLLLSGDRSRLQSRRKQRQPTGCHVGASGSDKPEPAEVREPEVRRFQFRLRTLLMAPVLLAGLFGWLAVPLHNARHNRRVIAAIEEMGGIPLYRPDRLSRSLRRPLWWLGMERV